jgi:hypothetical protein
MIVHNILGKSKMIDGSNIFPITLNEYDDFQACSSVLYYSKAHFGEEYEKHNLLDLIIAALGEQAIKELERILSIVTKKQVTYYLNLDQTYGFKVDECAFITRDNYDYIRSVIMNQNLMLEQKIYKNKIVAEWAVKIAAAKSKNGVQMTFEDMVTTVSVYTGKTYGELAEQTIYQLQCDFNRIGKLIEYETTIAFMCAGDTKSKLNHYAEHIDLFRSPDEGLFIKQDKLSKALS